MATFLEGDDLLDSQEEQHFTLLRASGKYSDIEIDTMRAQKVLRNEASLCQNMLKCNAYLFDPSVDQIDVVLRLASCLEKLHRREEAVMLLGEHQENASCAVALVKLLFKANRNADSKRVALQVCSSFESQVLSRSSSSACTGGVPSVSTEDAIDAFNLAAWVSIHADDHTSAYKIWAAGSLVLPKTPSLSRQCDKRRCWDVAQASDAADCAALVGGAPAGVGGGFDVERDLDAFSVPQSLLCRTPALALFHSPSQLGRLVFRTRSPLLTPLECSRVLSLVDSYVSLQLNGNWGTVRSSSVPTTDVAVEDVPELRPWLRTLLESRLFPLASAAYPLLADGSTLVDSSTGLSRLRLHDAFIVRYDEKDRSLSLPEHSDTSAISFTVSLNPASDFDGGGTWFEALEEGGEGLVVDAPCGHACMFAGPLRHAGFPIKSGRRVILVLFLYVEDFEYGSLMKNYCSVNRMHEKQREPEQVVGEDGTKARLPVTKPSGDKNGGFVVYRQTVELASMLEKSNRNVYNEED